MSSLQKRFMWVSGSSFLAIVSLAAALLLMVKPAQAQQQSDTSHAVTAVAAPASGLNFLGAGLAFGLAALGAGIAVASVGAAALGVLSEKPGMMGNALIFVALGEGIVIFGFVMAFIIMNA